MNRLRRLIGRYFFAATLARRFSGSFETMMEAELGRLRDVRDAAGFVAEVERSFGSLRSNDYWNQTLPAELETSGARTPPLFAYHAALCVLGSPVLFSTLTVKELLAPEIKPKKANLDRHHLFPKAYLKQQGVTDKKQTNQIANQTLLEWPDNIKISDQPPAKYVPKLRPRFSDADWAAMHRDHALPDDWWELEYDEFLTARRKLMAGVIRRGFEAI